MKRPKTRSDCKGGVRPCPFATCEYHLIHDRTAKGQLVQRFDDIDDMTETCALDIADHGGSTNEEIAMHMGLSPQMISNIEQTALIKLRRKPNYV